MEKLVDYFAHHPVVFFIAVVFSFFVVFAFFRKIVQTLFVIGALMVLYAAYIHFTGSPIPDIFQHIWQWMVNLYQTILGLILRILKKEPEEGVEAFIFCFAVPTCHLLQGIQQRCCASGDGKHGF